MKMKRLLLVIFAGLQTLIVSVALAWSPLDVLEPAAQSGRLCYSAIAANEQEQEDQKNNNEEEEDEEEPDCD
jgi:hypothetical protein